MKKALLTVIAVVIIAAGLVYYFANKNSNNSVTNVPNTSSQTQKSSSATAQATDKVTIANFAFSPADVTVKKGTTVTWTNQDTAAHTITETDGKDGPKSGDLGQGQSYIFTYGTVGTFKYHCLVHPDMTGTVTVTE